MFIKVLDKVSNLIEKYCKGKDCSCYTNLMNDLISLDLEEKKRITKELESKYKKKRQDGFYYECPDCGYNTDDERKTDHLCNNER